MIRSARPMDAALAAEVAWVPYVDAFLVTERPALPPRASHPA